MSRYQVHKAIRQVANNDAAKAAFLKDRTGFLEGRDLTEEERRALIETEFQTLLGLGRTHSVSTNS